MPFRLILTNPNFLIKISFCTLFQAIVGSKNFQKINQTKHKQPIFKAAVKSEIYNLRLHVPVLLLITIVVKTYSTLTSSLNDRFATPRKWLKV